MAVNLEKDAYRYAIKNAFLHNGRADVGAIVGKMKALDKELDIREAMPAITEAVKKVNGMKQEEIGEEYNKFEEEGYELKPQEKAEGLPLLEWAEAGEEEVVTRYAPNPNGPFHLGNARAVIISHEYAKKYNGRFLLRFDDTDPKVKKPIENAEEIFKEDLNWLGCKVDETFFASDRLETYHRFMRTAIMLEKAYVCTCEPDKWRELVKQGEECACRSLGKEVNLARFEDMIEHKFAEGEAVLRIKTDLKHKDPSIRDWWAAKIVNEVEHPNENAKNVHVWPSYNFASAIDDHELGVTLIIRGQEHEQNATKQKFLYEYFEWDYPHLIHFGRVSLEGMVLSTSKIKKGIEDGEYTGWDDPRLGTIRALRKRGFQAEALRKAIIGIGIKSSDTSIGKKNLNSLNKEVLGEVERIPFVRDPVQLSVNYCPESAADVDGAKIELEEGEQKFIVARQDLEKAWREKSKSIRLRNAYNVKLKRLDEMDAEADFTGLESDGLPVAGWVLQGVDAVVVMPDNSKEIGLAGERLAEVEEGTVVSLDKFGDARIDEKKDGRILLYFTHE